MVFEGSVQISHSLFVIAFLFFYVFLGFLLICLLHDGKQSIKTEKKQSPPTLFKTSLNRTNGSGFECPRLQTDPVLPQHVSKPSMFCDSNLMTQAASIHRSMKSPPTSKRRFGWPISHHVMLTSAHFKGSRRSVM